LPGPELGAGTPGAGGAGNVGTLLNGSDPGPALTALLKAGASGCTWVAAAIGSQNAAGYQLASGEPVMAVGGFNGTDPAPTLTQFEEFAETRRIHYFVGGTITSSGDSAAIASWVAAHYTATTVDGVTLYDLSRTRTGTAG
jgi:hypothetical protein